MSNSKKEAIVLSQQDIFLWPNSTIWEGLCKYKDAMGKLENYNSHRQTL